MYNVLDKDTIILEIIPHLSIAKRGFVCNAKHCRINQLHLVVQVGKCVIPKAPNNYVDAREEKNKKIQLPKAKCVYAN